MADLSIIIPIYNGGGYLENVFEELNKIQDISHEVIIVDDHSEDDTFDIAKKFEQETENVFAYSLPEHSGPSAARNYGISVATGRYVTFQDADDYLYSRVSDTVKAADKVEADVMHPVMHYTPTTETHIHVEGMSPARCLIEFNVQNNQILTLEENHEDIAKGMLNQNILWTPCGKLFRREFLLEHGIRFPENIRLMEGMFFLLSCLLHANRYSLYPNGIYLIRETETSVLHTVRAEKNIASVLAEGNKGMELLDEMLQGVQDRGIIPKARERLCQQMDQIIQPVSAANPEIWDGLDTESTPLLRNPWWVARYVKGWHQISTESQKLLAEYQQEVAVLGATEKFLDTTKKVPRIIVLSSTYTMLLCLLYFQDWQKSIFICGGGVPGSVILSLKRQGVACYGTGDGNYINDVNTLQCIARYAQRNNIPVYGNDDPPEAVYFIEHNFTVVEDGNYNYRPEIVMDLKTAKRVMPDGEQYVPFGFNRFVKHIIMTGKHPVPDIVKGREEIIRIQALWNKKTKKEQDKILEVYSFPRKEIEQQMKNKKNCLLLGISSTAQGISTEEQEVAMYREMMEPYGEEHFIIKPHPICRTDLQKNFPNSFVLPREFPIDLVKLLGMKFKHVVGANCSALFNLFPPQTVEDRTDLMEKYSISLFIASDQPLGNMRPPEPERKENPPENNSCPPEDTAEKSKVQETRARTHATLVV